MWEILVLIFVQIVTESLPISSSSHFLLCERLISFDGHSILSSTIDFFTHGATLIIVALFFLKQWGQLFLRLIVVRLSRPSYRALLSLVLKLAMLVFLADVITGFFYLVIRIGLQDFLLFHTRPVVFVGLLITAFSLFSLSFLSSKSESESFDLRKALLLGLVQGLSLLPGVSRFATTYVAARWLSISVRRAFEISFLIYVPLLVADFSWSMFLVSKFPFSLTGLLPTVIIATVIGYLLFILAHRAVVGRKMWPFAFYVLFLSLLWVSL